ncbi:MAG: maleylpyruvate isomerase N-terminal domain-containing protein [Actinomycetota bacterium]|nr:maleylpyruvate isomerase N-terminal domain-containing protein [Actinomycetota bacterium]
MEKDPKVWLRELRRSHDLLSKFAETLGPDDVRRTSYCDEWSVAQVLSHLGSGAEIFSLILAAALSGSEPPDREGFQAVWDRWDAKDPDRQRIDFQASDAALLDALESIEDQLGSIEITAMGRQMDMAEFLGMRLGEHALHAWDVAVTFDPAAVVDAPAVELLIDRIPALGPALGRPATDVAGAPQRVVVATVDPIRAYTFDIGAAVTVAEVARDADSEPTRADLRLPAEALLRLVYGRLDAGHAPPLDPVDDARSATAIVDMLRATYPGF